MTTATGKRAIELAVRKTQKAREKARRTAAPLASGPGLGPAGPTGLKTLDPGTLRRVGRHHVGQRRAPSWQEADALQVRARHHRSPHDLEQRSRRSRQV